MSGPNKWTKAYLIKKLEKRQQLCDAQQSQIDGLTAQLKEALGFHEMYVDVTSELGEARRALADMATHLTRIKNWGCQEQAGKIYAGQPMVKMSHDGDVWAVSDEP